MNIRKAELMDIGKVIVIYKNAIKAMIDSNLDQWDDIYPAIKILEQDITANQMYVGIIDDKIVSAVVANTEFDEEYKNGRWKYDNKNFAVIHRLCVNPAYQNKKVGRNTMILTEELLKKEGVQSIRLDAFSLNPYALKLYESLGYQKVGEATWRKGLFYLFEKKL